MSGMIGCRPGILAPITRPSRNNAPRSSRMPCAGRGREAYVGTNSATTNADEGGPGGSVSCIRPFLMLQGRPEAEWLSAGELMPAGAGVEEPVGPAAGPGGRSEPSLEPGGIAALKFIQIRLAEGDDISM